MPVHINLIHEEKAELRARQRDPLKLSMIAAGVIFLCLVGLYFVKSAALRSLKKQNAVLAEEWQRKEPLMKEAEAKELEHGGVISQAATLTKMSEERFYWAPLLEGLLKAVPREMSLDAFTGSVTLSSDAAKPGHTITATLKGLTAGQDPRQVAEDVRMSFLKKMQAKREEVNVVFGSLDDSSESVLLDGVKLQTATFAIDISFFEPSVKEVASE